jgi:hypothetical protein
MANDVQDMFVIDKRARVTSEGYRDPFCRSLFSVDSRPQVVALREILHQ